MSIRYKIAFLFALLVTILFSIASVSVYFFTLKDREHTFNTRLKNRAISTARVFDDIDGTNYNLLKRIDATSVSSLYEKSILVLTYDNVKAYSYTDVLNDTLQLSDELIERIKIDGEHYFMYKNKAVVAIHQSDDDHNFIVAVAALDVDGKQYLQQLQKILWITTVTSVALSFYAGLVFARNLISPIKKIITEVNLISSNNLSQRIKLSNSKDELTRLAETFNNLLDRLQESFTIQRRFISNASHELSTPLTSISSQLEVAMQKSRTEGEYQAMTQSVYEDVKALQLLTRSLLDIAKAGSQGSIDLNEVRLDEVLFKVLADIKKQTASYKVQLDTGLFPADEAKLTVFGNANLLYIALKNIIDNACKYADDEQAIVQVVVNELDIVIKVLNKGDVIAPEELQHIFQPFFRAASAHHKPGSGLGLTLARRIVYMHKGAIEVSSDSDNGTMFITQLPNMLAKI